MSYIISIIYSVYIYIIQVRGQKIECAWWVPENTFVVRFKQDLSEAAISRGL